METSAPDNIYLPKLAILDRVVEEIAEVKTFYWRFTDPREQDAFRGGGIPGVVAAQPNRDGDVFHGAAGGQLHRGAAPA